MGGRCQYRQRRRSERQSEPPHSARSKRATNRITQTAGRSNRSYEQAPPRLLTIFLDRIICTSPRPPGALVARRRAGGTKGRAPPERRRCSSGRGPAIPGHDRCGARGPASQAGTRATAGLRPEALRPPAGSRLTCGPQGSQESAARRRSENAAMARRETRRFRKRSRA